MTYCFDLDGTLCTIEIDYHCAIPFKDRIETVNSLYDAGHVIMIDSARGNTTGINCHEETKQQLKEWGLKYHILRTGVKFTADRYIDDKAIESTTFFHQENQKKT